MSAPNKSREEEGNSLVVRKTTRPFLEGSEQKTGRKWRTWGFAGRLSEEGTRERSPLSNG